MECGILGGVWSSVFELCYQRSRYGANWLRQSMGGVSWGNIDRGQRTPSSEILASSFCKIDDLSGKAIWNRDRLVDSDVLDRCRNTDRALNFAFSVQVESSPETLPTIASIFLDFLAVIGVQCRALRLQWTCRNS